MPPPLALDWPLVALDLEASSVDEDGYPIEIGIAIIDRPGSRVRFWSSLVRPTWRWAMNGHWSMRSQKVHGIARADLALGLDPIDVVVALQEEMPAGVAWCDGGAYDVRWVSMLYDAAGKTSSFRLRDIAELTADNNDLRRAMATHLKAKPAMHRAGPDAARLATAIAATFKLQP